MKIFKSGLSLALLGAGLAFAPGASSAALGTAPQAADQSVVSKLKDEASGSVRTTTERATGKVSFVRATGSGADLMPSETASTSRDAVAKATAYLAKYSDAFGAGSDELTRSGVKAGDYGTTVTYVQDHEGVPVFGAMVKAHLDEQGDLTSVNGELVPVDAIDTTASLTPSEAGARGLALVKAQPPSSEDGSVDLTGVKPVATNLVVYKRGLVQGLKDGATELVYQVEVGNGSSVRDMVFVNADTGKVVNRYSMMADAIDRELYEADEDRNLELVWKEGDPLPGELNVDQENLVNSTGEAYWLFRNTFGRDSYDGQGATMRTINNDPAIACPNANWNGTTTNYCDGVTSDDVVSHEWTHAYTEYTHGLIYQYQSGALNEGYSDVFGETLDLVNNREDEGEGDISSPRPVGLCSSHSSPNPLLSITAPASIAKDCLTGGYLGPDPLVPLDGEVAAPTDAVEAGGTATDGCSPYEQDVTGKIVLVDRGLCPFVQKAEVAKAEGAAGVIIGNSENAPVSFSSPDQTLPPTVAVGLDDRTAIRAAVTAGETVTVSITDASGERFDSYRWLVGEKSTAFGGAIRDMWNPTCYGDPGKVSDAEYKCSTDDNGGVHGNSGVVNHGYALLVDGGVFNDVDVTGIGIDKALAVYYRAMTDYQTPASNFVDHADALVASCTDLTNKAINEVTVGDPGGSNDPVRSKQKITADDCAQVAAMTEAVELRLDPTEQCNFEPLLTPGVPAPLPCDVGGDAVNLFTEDFEKGLGAWSKSAENPYDGLTAEWETVRESDYEGDHTGAVAYGPAPDKGACDGTTNDFSSVDYLTSPTIQVPSNATDPRMTFEHSIATEVGFDGGNVQVSVNGGDFAPVPAEAYTFNEPGQLSTAEEGNTNPLAGQPGFTGVDPNKLYSEWGTSQIDLAQLETEIAGGDDVKIRFAIGRDGCGGVEGWFVDNVALAVCTDGTVVVDAVHQPEPSTFGEVSTVEVTSLDGTGDATVTEGETELGSAAVVDGKASVELPADLSVGEHTLTVTVGDVSTDITATVVGAASEITAVHTPEPSSFGKASTVDVTAADATSTGDVTVSLGERELGTATLEEGAASVPLPANLPAGKHDLTVAYAGDSTHEAVSTELAITIKRAATTTKATGPKQIRSGAVATVKVRVTSPGVDVPGRVQIIRGGDVVASGVLKGKVATLKVRGLNKVGTTKLTARYVNGPNFTASRDTFTIRVR